MAVDLTCPTVILNLGSTGTITFDCDTPDEFSADGTTWFWSELDGWWEPPQPIRSTLRGPNQSGALLTEEITASRWAPREITLTVYAITNGVASQFVDALNTVAAMGTPHTYGSLVVLDDVPKAAAVRLGGRPSTEVMGHMKQVKVVIPLIAHDPLRTILGPGTRVL